MIILTIIIARYVEDAYTRKKYRKYVQDASLLYMITEIICTAKNVDTGNIFNCIANRQYRAVGIFLRTITISKWRRGGVAYVKCLNVRCGAVEICH